MTDNEFLKTAIKQSELSVKQGLFPAGSLVVLNNEIITLETSGAYPGYTHSECNAIDKAFQKAGKLAGATLYTSMEPCFMCIGRAYWSGIRRIVFAIGKNNLKLQYYEGTQDNRKLVENMNESMEYLQIIDLENDALEIVRAWEEKYIGK